MRPFFGLALVAALAGGCNSDDARELSQDAGKLAKTAGRAAGNVGLAAKVNTALVNRKGIDMSGLRVETKDGVVTVGGHVRNAEERRRVIDTIDGVRGVEKVVDNLRIQAR